MKIMLVDPHYKEIKISPPFLGFACINAVLSGHEVNSKSFHIERNCTYEEFFEAEKKFYEDLDKEFSSRDYDMAGITGTSGVYPRMLKIAEIAKKNDIKQVVMGGTHITLLAKTKWKNQIWKDSKYVDAIVLGDGEIPFLSLASGTNPELVTGVSTKNVNNPPYQLSDLDVLPLPNWDIFNMEKFPKMFYFSTAKGCKYNCAFCDEKLLSNCYIPKSPKRVIAELKYDISRYGVRNFRFCESTFTSNPYLYEICDAIIKERLDIEWICFARANEVNPKMLEAMKKAGCICVYYGIESGNQKILNAMKKGITIEQIKNAVKISKEAGLSVKGSFILGFPGETKEMAEDTIEFARHLELDISGWHIYGLNVEMMQNYNLDVDWKSMYLDIPEQLIEEVIKRKSYVEKILLDRHAITHLPLNGEYKYKKPVYGGLSYFEMGELLKKASEVTKKMDEKELYSKKE